MCIDSNGTQYDIQNASTAEMLSLILRFIYILMRPLMTIGWYAMDNSLVYGELFHLDIALYQFRNMIKNMCNYFLAFYFIRTILKEVWWWWWNLTVTIRGLLKKTILAAVGIQVSRRAMGALLDLSTIMTYRVWAIPLTAIRDNESIDQAVLSTHSVYKTSDVSSVSTNALSNTYIYYSYGNENYIQCNFMRYKLPESVDVPNAGTPSTPATTIWTFVPSIGAQGAIGWKEYFDTHVTKIKEWFASVQKNIPTTLQWTFKSEYCVDNGKLLKHHEPNDTITIEWIWSKTPIDLNNMYVYKWVYDEWSKYLKTLYSKKNDPAVCWVWWDGCSTISEIIQLWKWFTWPLYTLYASILNFGNLAISTDNKTIYSLTLEFIIKAIFSIALMVPLILICLMLIARAMIMRLVIAFSPVIAIFYAFEWDPSGQAQQQLTWAANAMWYDKEMNFSGIIGLIFMPVVCVMALSIGLVFMHIMAHMTYHDPANMLAWLGISIDEENRNCTHRWEVATLCHSQNNTWDDGFSIFTNSFNRFIINLLAVGIMWTIMMAVLKSVGIFSGIADKATSLTKTLLTSTPIIPLPSGATSLAWLQWGMDRIGQDLETKVDENTDKQVNDFMQRIWFDKKEKNNTDDTEQRAVTTINSLPTFSAQSQKPWQSKKEETKALVNNPNTSYNTTAQMSTALAQVWNDLGSVLGELKWNKEWEQILQKIAEWYENISGAKDDIKDANWLIDATLLTEKLKTPIFREKIAQQMYQENFSKKSIDKMLNTFWNVTDENSQTIAFKDHFWNKQSIDLDILYKDQESKNAKIPTFDIGSKKYYVQQSVNSLWKMKFTKVTNDSPPKIEWVYPFAYTWSGNFDIDSSTVIINNKADIENICNLISALHIDDQSIDTSTTDNTKVLYCLRSYESQIQSITDWIKTWTNTEIKIDIAWPTGTNPTTYTITKNWNDFSIT
jgi:hypothetical protein